MFFGNGSRRFSHHDTGDGEEGKREKGTAKRGGRGKTWTTRVLVSPRLWRRPHPGNKMILVLQTTKARPKILCMEVVGDQRGTTLKDTGQHSELTTGSTAPADTPATQFLYLRPQRTLKTVERD